MRRFLFITALLVPVLLAAVVGLAFWLLNDEAFLRERLAQYAQEATGRELIISGPLEIDLGRETTIEVSGVTLGNADWADSPHMLEVGHARVTIDIPGLFDDRVYLPNLLLENCAIEIIENDAGESNWAFPGEADEPEAEDETRRRMRLALEDVLVSNCSLLHDNPDRQQPLMVQADSIKLKHVDQQRLVGDISGRINGEALEVDGWLAPASALTAGGKLEHELSFRAGDVTLNSSGTVTDIKTFSGADVDLRFQGPDIARLLGDYALPPVSTGAFDLHVNFTSQDEMVDVTVDGDLGNLDIAVDGLLDKLVSPSVGNLDVTASGPNLQAIGKAFGTEFLLPDPFSWAAGFRFEPGMMHIEHARLETELDRLDMTGAVSMQHNLANSLLELSLSSDEIGRWASLAGEATQELGPAELDGDVLIDANGTLSFDARARYLQSEFITRGELGVITGPIVPELDFEFRSTNMPRLANLVGYEGFPARPIKLGGHLRKEGQSLQFSNLELLLNNSSVTASGNLSLATNFAGSELNGDIDIPDVAELGLLFGVDNLFHEPLRVTVHTRLEDGGLVFDIGDGNLGAIRLKLDGRIHDLAQPAGIDANVDVHFPGLKFARIWLPDLALPEGPLAVRGRLRNRSDRTELEDLQLTLSEIEAKFSGHVAHDLAFDLAIDANGPDVTVLDELVGVKFEDVPFSVTTRLAGTPRAFSMDDLDLKTGKSVVRGDIDFELGENRRIAGHLVSPYLDLNPWTVGKETEEETPRDSKARYVFDDTPVVRIPDIGMEIDSHLVADVVEVSNARFEDVEIGLHLVGGRLEIKPFSADGVAGGAANGELVIDSSKNSSELSLNLTIDNLRSGLGAKEGQDPATLPRGDMVLDLHGKGRTKRELASNLDGKIRLELGPGKLAPSAIAFLVTDFASQLLRTINPSAEKYEYTELECAVAAADIESGQVRVEPVVLHSRQMTVVSNGKVDLDSESIDLEFNTKQRKGIGISASDIVNPFIKVGGTLASPSLELDPAGTVVKGGLAVATVGLSILASSVADRYLSSKDPCGDALRQIEKQDGSGR